MNDNIIKEPITPSNIVFTSGYGQTEVMRITRDGVFVNPDIAVNDAAKAVLDAIDSQIKVLVQKAVEEESEKITKELMQIFTDPENQPSQYGTVTVEYMDERIQEIISGNRKWHLTATDAERIAFDTVCDGVAQKIRGVRGEK